jgi:eukaryotic translation initiation factor 2C
LIKVAFKKSGCTDTKIIVVVPNKLHNMRFTPATIIGDRAPDQNVKPGTVIDTQVVHPTWNEFYLCGHTTLQVSHSCKPFANAL